MNHGSLFSGGGGFDLAAEMMGWNNIFHCEIDPFCNRILNHYWPDAQSINNIREFNAKQFKGKIDILTGGFPCQPFSEAGKRKGTNDNRYLWPDMLRVIQEIQPTWVVAENVYGIVSWNEGMVFEQVHAGLEAAGYEVQAFVLPACGVGAPHRRYRVWFVAHTNSTRLEGGAYTREAARSWQRQVKQFARLCSSGYWRNWPTQSPVCRGDDGLPCELDGISVSKWRRESIKMYGNAIVPQVALQIFNVIEQMRISD